MSSESTTPPLDFGCVCLREVAADPKAPFAFNGRLMEFELRTQPEATTFLYYCPFCGEPTPESLRGSFFVRADDAERARLDALTAGINNEEEMRARFGTPDWELHVMTFRDFSPSAYILAQFREDKCGVIYIPKPNPAAPEIGSRRIYDPNPDRRPVPTADETGKCSESCTCGALAGRVADPKFGLRFHSENKVFELEVHGWKRVVRHCWFCGGKAPEILGIPRYLFPDEGEEARINEAIAHVHSSYDALKVFGPLHRDRREVRYHNLSTTAIVAGRTVDGKWNGVSYLPKYTGPKDA